MLIYEFSFIQSSKCPKIYILFARFFHLYCKGTVDRKFVWCSFQAMNIGGGWWWSGYLGDKDGWRWSLDLVVKDAALQFLGYFSPFFAGEVVFDDFGVLVVVDVGAKEIDQIVVQEPKGSFAGGMSEVAGKG